jgi:hypothetical protein
LSKTGLRMRPEMEATAGQWVYVYCECHVHVASTLAVAITYRCEACGNTNLRFIHTLEHLETKKQIQVGIECACILMDDDLPYLAENETKRKERWRRERFNRPGRCSTTPEDLEERGKI